MSFRKPKSRRDSDERRWREWLERHGAALRGCGLPAGVILSEGHWVEFLQNGSVERHAEAADGFWFGELNAEHMAGLLAVLEGSPEYAGEPMVGWLRVRLGREA